MIRNLTELRVVEGTITTCDDDAIVNAANSSLLGGGGVDGAIHRAAGPELVAECRPLNGCRVGEAKITRGHRLKAPHVIHTVGPVWNGGSRDEDALLAACYAESLKLAAANGLRRIAFPAISTGRYRFPIDCAARIAVATVIATIDSEPQAFDRITFVCFDSTNADALRGALASFA